jgi:Ca2+-transporting ATPase
LSLQDPHPQGAVIPEHPNDVSGIDRRSRSRRYVVPPHFSLHTQTLTRSGLLLVVTLALAFATKHMASENLLVRVLGSCETMGNASVVCTDSLTVNDMAVVAGSIGVHCKFVRQLEGNSGRANAVAKTAAGEASRRHPDDFIIDQAQLNTVLPPWLRTLFNEAIAVNSTAFEDRKPESGELVFVGSRTETALFNFAKKLSGPGLKQTRDSAEVVQMMPFSSECKSMGVVIRSKGNGNDVRVYFKGASEVLSKRCRRHVVVTESTAESDDEAIKTAESDEDAEENIAQTITFYEKQTLRTIALCYRDFKSWPPEGMELNEENEVNDSTYPR